MPIGAPVIDSRRAGARRERRSGPDAAATPIVMRRLITTRRRVPLDRIDEYLERWARLRRAAEDGGGHGWLFRAAGREDQHVEFLESSDVGRLLEREAVAAALQALDDAFGEGQTEEWEEAPTP
ncbi:MAG TPA: hypothetical protein VF188_11970 [Longimicrobiales bacterium]